MHPADTRPVRPHIRSSRTNTLTGDLYAIVGRGNLQTSGRRPSSRTLTSVLSALKAVPLKNDGLALTGSVGVRQQCSHYTESDEKAMRL